MPPRDPFGAEHPSAIVSPPPDLARLFQRAEGVPRYRHPDYPANFSSDTTAAHTERLIKMALPLGLPAAVKDELVRMLWVHDLPEVITQDVTSIEKEADTTLASRIALHEARAAERLLAPTDRRLLHRFNLADGILKAKAKAKEGDLAIAGPVALIAKIVDIADNNVGFHYFLTRWIMSPAYDAKLLPPEAALTYTFRQYAALRPVIENLGLNTNLGDIAQRVFKEQLTAIDRLWKAILYSRIPPEIKAQIHVSLP
jgi:hypothetical protein